MTSTVVHTTIVIVGSAPVTLMSMVEFRVATYNVLSSHLADPPRFPECDPKHLHAPTRLERVKAKLQEEVSGV